MKTKKGNVAHVRGSNKMNETTIAAIEKMIDLVANTDFEDKKIPCHACQGGGCTVCNGFGYYYN